MLKKIPVNQINQKHIGLLCVGQDRKNYRLPLMWPTPSKISRIANNRIYCRNEKDGEFWAFDLLYGDDFCVLIDRRDKDSLFYRCALDFIN